MSIFSITMKRMWDSLTPEEEIKLRKKRGKAMKLAWKRKSKEEKAAISIKMSARMHMRYFRKEGKSPEEIDAFLKEKFGFTVQELEEDTAKRRGKTWKRIMRESKAQGMQSSTKETPESQG